MSRTKIEIGEITEILSQWNNAKEESLDNVFPRVYETLKRLAKKARRDLGRSAPEETLSTTALVNEMYFQLRESESLNFKSRGHFYALCLVTMRRMLRDYYVRRISKARSVALATDFETAIQDLVNLPFLSGPQSSRYSSLELMIIVDELLVWLEDKHPRKAEALCLKYFLGATESEVALCLGTAERTVRRDCSLGETLLRNKLETSSHPLGEVENSRTSRSTQLMLKELEALLRQRLRFS